MYIQCVNSELVRNWNVFKNIKLNDIQTIDGSSNEIVTPDEILKCPGKNVYIIIYNHILTH